MSLHLSVREGPHTSPGAVWPFPSRPALTGVVAEQFFSRSRDSSPMSTVSVISRTPKPGPHPAGRRCAHRDCTAFLSRYNGTDYCSIHGQWWDDDVSRQSEATLCAVLGPQDYATRRLRDAA